MSNLADLPTPSAHARDEVRAPRAVPTALPLLQHFATDATIGWREGSAVTASQFIRAAHALAAQMPVDAKCMNLCADRLNFALGIAAALIRRNPVLLPPNRAPDVLRDLSAAHGPAYCVTDMNNAPDGMPHSNLACWPEHSNDGPPPQVPGDHTAAIAFTSGSTGQPRAHARNWQSYVQGAQGLHGRLPLKPGAVLLGTVPPQHMWGLEASVLLAMHAGCAIHSATPLLPADICHALEHIDGERWLVTTPLHLRTLLKSAETLPRITGVLSATAALDAATAQAFEAATGAIVYEIYGTTETGALATRQPAQQRDYRFLPGVNAQSTDELCVVRGGHVHQPVVVNDALKKRDEQHFELEGRVTDMIKIAGKRASLSALNLDLLAIPGVVDGVFFVPPGGVDTRLAAFVVAPGVDRRDIIVALRKRIDPVFLPRPLHIVPQLPRNATGKITQENLLKLAAHISP